MTHPTEAITEAAKRLLEVASAEWAPWEVENPRLAAVARGLCRADGHLTDIIVMGQLNQLQSTNAGLPCLDMPIQPSWVLYLSRAQEVINLVDDTR